MHRCQLALAAILYPSFLEVANDSTTTGYEPVGQSYGAESTDTSRKVRSCFQALVAHGLKSAGGTHTLLSDSGMELLRQASQGLPRHAGRLIKTAMQMAVPKGRNLMPDELIQQAIEELR